MGAESNADSRSAVIESQNDSAHIKRRLLAQDFVTRLKLKKTVAQNDQGSTGGIQSIAQSELTQVAPGTEMQFRPRSENIMLDYDVYAIVGENDFYIALTDLIAALNFPITIDEDAQTASGWFLREDWRFNLDVKAWTASSRGQSYTLGVNDVRVVNGDVFIAGKIIGAWLGMEFKYDIAQQYVDIISEYPLPIVAQIKRRSGMGSTRTQVQSAILPRQDYERKWLDVNVADVSLRTNYYRPGQGGDSTVQHRGDLFLSGEALKHDAFMILGADKEEGLNSITARLSRASDERELLGPLKARSYMMGDIDTLNMPLMGSTGQELGFRVSSNPLSGISYQNTQITGYALPGWDVELYRGASRLDSLTVDDSGRYQFDNIQLYSGDNDFDVYFYGNQGEIRRETLNIPLDTRTLAQQVNTYDVSVSLKDSKTYRKNDFKDDDTDTLHAAGQYNFALGNALAYTGLRLWNEDGEQKIYLGSGLTAIWAGTIIDANVAAEDNGEIGGQVGLRRTIYDWRTAFAAQVQSDGFAPGDGDVATTLRLNASTQRDWNWSSMTQGAISFHAQHNELSNDTQSQSFAFGLSQGFSRISFSNSIGLDTYQDATGATTEQVSNEFTTLARWSGALTTRTGVTYIVRPDSYMDRYFASINYSPTNNLNFDVDLTHRPETSYSEAEFRANYTHQRFRLSPFLRYDSDRDIAAGFNISTSLVDTPQGGFPLITSERLASQGMVSALVYLDVNGNMKFDAGDEILPDVMVESVNSYRKEPTNENGYALLSRLSTTIATDIRVDRESLPDPFMVAMNPGNSILPRPSVIYEMEFPIQFSSEVDGTISIRDEDGVRPVKFVEAILYPTRPGAEPIRARAAQDGFYVVTMIPPGQYYMTTSSEDAKTLKVARPIPQLMSFSHAGDSIYAHNVVLQKGQEDIQFSVLDPGALNDWTGPATFLRLPQDEKGGLLNLVYRLRMREVMGQVTAGLRRYDSSDANGNIIARYVVPGGLDEAWARCEVMARDKLPCAVEIVPDAIVPALQPVAKPIELTKVSDPAIDVAVKQ
jgi:hypothetical protein